MSVGYEMTTSNGSCGASRTHLHRAIWEDNFGPIPTGYIVHHIDGDIHNNCIDNLRCMTMGDHTKLHMALLKRDPKIRLRKTCKCNGKHKSLTERQLNVYNAVKDFIHDYGYAPSVRQIRELIGVTSVRGVTIHLDALEKKGWIERGTQARAIKLVA
jgi:hypothetical protein